MDPSIIKTLRLRLNLTQEDFARELGVSTPSVRNYEKGHQLSDSVVEKVKTLAAKHRLTDLLINEGGVMLPGPTKVLEVGSRIAAKRHPEGNDLADHLHDAIDKIIESGNLELVAAVEAVVNLALRASGTK